MVAPTRFCILGALEVWLHGVRRTLGGQRQERVLASLLLQPGQAVPLSRLVEAVWGPEPPATARHQVRKIMGELRQLLGSELIVTDGAGYRIDLSIEQLDLLQFQQYLRAARDGVDPAVNLRAGLGVWRGSALSGVDGPVIAAAALMLDESRVDALERLAALALTSDEAGQVIPDLQHLLADHPLRETLRGHLMVALCRTGRQAEALGVFEEGRCLLRDELGVDPGPQLSRLYERVLRSDPTLVAIRTADDKLAGPSGQLNNSVPISVATLPYDISDFTGRRIEMSALLTIVPEAAQQALTIVTIDGMPGVGKSALAIHAAHRLAKRFPDGQLFVDLHGFTSGRVPMDPAEALDTLLRALGVSGDQIPDDLATRSALWRSRIAGRRLLLLLDNAAESAQVRPLIPGTPGSLVLVTSRARLSALDGAVPISLSPPGLAESRTLVNRLLDPERAAAEPDAVDELIEVCGALPLALRVSAARLNNRPQWTIARLVRRLRSAERDLDELSIDDRSVAAAFRLSYDGLGADQQRMFRLLSLHPAADWSPPMAASLTEVSLEKAEDLLEDLLDARLLEQRLPGRYTFHNLFRSYARLTARVVESKAEQDIALRRLYDYSVLTLRQLSQLIRPGTLQADFHCEQPSLGLPPITDAVAAYAFLDAEVAGFISMTRSAPGLGLDLHAVHLACDLAQYLQVRGHYRLELELMESAVKAAVRISDLSAEMRALVGIYVPQKHFGQLDEAQRSTDRAYEIALQLGDLTVQGMLLSRMGAILIRQGKYAEGLEVHLQAQMIHEESGNTRQEATNLIAIAVAQDELGRYSQALVSERSALNLALLLGDHSLELVAMINIANTLENLDQFDAALDTLAATRILLDQNDYPMAAAIVARSNAELSRKTGKLEEAMMFALQSKAALVELGSEENISSVDNILGKIYQDLAEFSTALTYHRAARERSAELKLKMGVVRALQGMGIAFRALGESAAAREYWEEALREAEGLDAPEITQIKQALNSLE